MNVTCNPRLTDDFVWRCKVCGDFIDSAVISPGDGIPVNFPGCRLFSDCEPVEVEVQNLRSGDLFLYDTGLIAWTAVGDVTEGDVPGSVMIVVRHYDGGVSPRVWENPTHRITVTRPRRQT